MLAVARDGQRDRRKRAEAEAELELQVRATACELRPGMEWSKGQRRPCERLE